MVELQNEINEFEDQVVHDSKIVENLRKNTQLAQMSAGLLEVKGPGIIITLDYTPLEEDMGFDPF